MAENGVRDSTLTGGDSMSKKAWKSAVVFAVLLATSLFAETPGSVPNISVIGTGAVYQTPDVAYIDFNVQSSSPSAITARDSNSVVFTKVVKALEKLNVPKQDLIILPLSLLSFDYQQGNFSKQELGMRRFRVKVPIASYPDAKRVFEVSDAVVAAGAVIARQPTTYVSPDYEGPTYTGVNFSVKNMAALEDSARSLAIKNADEQARSLAGKKNVKIKKIISLGTSDPGYSIVPALSVSEEAMIGKVKCAVTVTASYEIE